jgi:hypothetical protein
MALAGSALACDPAKCSKAVAGKDSKCSKAFNSAGDRHAGCAKGGGLVAKVMAKLPKMTYRAGELETPCFKTAVEKAGDESKVQCLVGGKSYDCRGDATAALVSLLEQETEQLMTVRMAVGDEYVSCPITAKSMAAQKGTKLSYRLAGLNYETREKAESAAEAVRAAIAKFAAEDAAVDAAAAKPCCPEAKTASGKPCCPEGKSSTASSKAGCSKAKAQTVAGAADKAGCSKSKASTASGKAGCSKAKAQTVAGTADTTAKAGCGKKTLAAGTGAKAGCSKKKEATAVARRCGTKTDAAAAELAASKSACGQKKGSTVAAGDDCCAAAEKRLAAVRAKLEIIVETAAKGLAS